MKTTVLSLMLIAGLVAGAQAHAAPVTLINAGFEANWTTQLAAGSDGYVTFNYAPTGPNVGWAFNIGAYGSSGVAASYGTLTAYQGSRFALLQLGNPADPLGATGNRISQSFILDAASDVDLSFAMALRPGYQPGQSVAVALDGQILTFFTATPGWSVKNMTLGSLTAGSHVLSFAGTANYATYGDTTAYLDAVQLDAVPTPVVAAIPEPESYALLLAGLGLLGFTVRRRRA
ncbi:MAG: PEP-CTERM putative exosortase interaction domain-containing protein [Gallionellaceae bacterium]|nr:MAG: PEP-CTERM putative exosortase interaction domain-containing protein [Gallionellaceae bacterium]